MKHTAICPKCGSDDIVTVTPREKLLTGVMTGVYTKKFICCRCGYVETWISQSDLEKVKKGVSSLPYKSKKN